MKLARKVGATSQILQIFIADSSSTTGAGLTGLVFNSSGLTAYYNRDTDASPTAISLVTMTVGTFTSSGFKEISSANMPGWYQLCVPNAALASGAKSVGIHLKGATNMAPLPIEIDLQADVNVELFGGTAGTFTTAGYPDVAPDWGKVRNPSTVVSLSGTDIETATTVENIALAIQADLPQRITKNTALSAFMFKLVSSTDHISAVTGVTVTATRSLDGAAFASCANSATEVSGGWYKIDLAAADLNANVVVLKFTGTGADTREIVLITQPT
jgi:hypothetical protein